MNAAVSPHLRSLEALQAQISAQNEISCLLREQLHDLRINRDAWRTQAKAAQHILIDGRPRRRLFGWSSTIGKVDALFKRCLLLILLAAVLLTPSNSIPVSQDISLSFARLRSTGAACRKCRYLDTKDHCL